MSEALTRPNLIARAISIAALAGVVVAVVLLLQGGPTYTLNLQMTNANGVRPGFQVELGGVPVGTVGSVDLGPHDRVIAKLDLNPTQVHVGRGATADISTANLLGLEYVAVHPGNPRLPLASGSTLPINAVTVPTDLDQIIDVLDPDTQQALATLINEAGIAVAGRQSDVSAILKQLPLSVEPATQLLTQVVHDNHTLKDLIASGNQFITRINLQRGDLARVINAASGAATTTASRADNIRQTLVGAPQALLTMQRLLVSAGHTTRALTQPAGEIADTAAPLDGLLAQVKPFEQAAVPALNRAAQIAPQLTALGERGTPIVRRAVPTLAAIWNVAKILQPLTYWLGANVGGEPGISGVLGVVQGWAQAIQFRDALGHEFQGQVELDPSLIVKLANLGESPKARRANEVSAKKSLAAARSGSAAPTTGATGSTATKPTPSGTNSGLTGAVQGLTGGGAPTGSLSGPSPNSLSSLLNYLLGK